MKSPKAGYLIGIFLLMINTYSMAQNLYAYVSGDTVTLLETQAYRNCGAMYRMEVIQDEFTLNWYQIDTGATALCYCVFDVSVTYAPLEAGNYVANIYYTDAWSPLDTIYEGSVDFIIGPSGRAIYSGGIISQYQSDCYTGQGLDDENEIPSFSIYPVPVRDGRIFRLETDGIYEGAVLEVFTMSGQKIYSKEYKGNAGITDQWMSEMIFPGPGIYLARLKANKHISAKLIPVL